MQFEYVAVEKIDVEDFDGDVFNLDTDADEFIAEDVVVHNCPHLWDIKPEKVPADQCPELWVG